MWALAGPDGVSLTAEGRTLAVLPTSDTTAASILAASDVVLVPKALTLTMFVRLICGDLLIHGRGGARYDRVTEGVVRRFFGIELPAHVVASATMRLPLRVTHVTDEDVSAATERLNRLTHHPDEWLADAHLDDASAKEVALGLVRRKAQLVSDIGRPGADRKSLGIEIKAVNAQLAAVLEPVRLELEAELTRLSELRAAVEIIEDRTYPFCFFDPLEVAALVR